MTIRTARVVAVGIVAALVAVGGGSAAPERDELIRPGVGIGKVKLGMTYGAVRVALGRPTSVIERRRVGFQQYFIRYAWGFDPSWTVGVLGRGNAARVVSIATTVRRERTASGVGIGSTHVAVQRTLGARCYSDGGHINTVEGRYCFVGRRGAPRTFFYAGRDCSIPEDRHKPCPESKLTFRVYEVLIADKDGMRLQNLFAG